MPGSSRTEDPVGRHGRVDLAQLRIVVGPRKAKGAIRAPVLTPVTILNSGRVPVSLQPFIRPAPNAPLSPPPETAR